MDKSQAPPFTELVEKHLDAESRELWIPIAEEFNRDGPEAAKMYLDTEGQRLQDRVRNLLSQIEGN